MLRNSLQLVFLTIIFVSCSSSESISDDLLAEINSENYFPLENSNHWVYEVDSERSEIDSLWIEKDTLIEGEIHYQISANSSKTGFITNLLTNSLLHKSKNKLILNGVITDLISGIEIPVENLVLLDPKNPVGNTMHTSIGTSTTEKEGYIIEVAHTITTKTEALIEDYSLFGEDYSNVIKTSMVVNLSGVVTTTVNGFEVTVSILKPKDVIVSIQYFAPGIGIINNETNVDYQLTNIDQLSIPLEMPTKVSEITSQHIANFSKISE